MSISKSLYEAPQGLESLDAPDIEIEIEDPEAVHIGLGDVEIDIEPEETEDFEQNLLDVLDSGYVETLASELVADFDDDLSSRKDWMQTYVEGIELLGLKIEERTDPWPGACGVYHPLLSEALVRFQAETIMEILPAAGPVKTEIIGKETPEKKEAAIRVASDMNHEIMDVMTEFRPETERMLWGLGMSGNGFKKVYVDQSRNRQTSVYVTADDIVVPYGASSIETAERVTHVLRKTKNELRQLQIAGFYDDVDLGEPMNIMDEVEKKIAEKMGFRATSDDRFKLLEMHVNLDIPGFEHTDDDGEPTGLALPYVVTIEKGTGKCLAIRRNWREDDDTHQKRQHFVHYGYIPGFGFYCFGLIHLIGAFAKSGTSLIRQLVDAGTLSNLPGGFKSRGLRVKGDDTPIGPGEFRDVDVASGTIKDNILPLPYKEPSQVLAGLFDKIIEEGRRFANAADLQVSDMSANAPVGTTLAILERTLKPMSAVQARIHYSFKQELRLLKDIIRDFAPTEYSYEPETGDRTAKQSDYDMVDVIPVSDPNAATMSQKVVQYQAVIQLAQMAPQLYDLAYLHRQMLEVLGIKNASKLVKLEEDAVPLDPISENINVVKGKPVKAFLAQDHDAHIASHVAFMQDPIVGQTLGQNPQANMILAALQAHIAEHLGYQYRSQLEKQMGVALPEPDKPLPPEVEVQLSRLIAVASQQLLQAHQSQAAQQQAQQQQQDPVVQMQQQDLQIRAEEVKRKAAKDQMDAQLKMAEINAQTQRSREQVEAQKEIADRRNEKDSRMEHLRLAVNTITKNPGKSQ